MNKKLTLYGRHYTIIINTKIHKYCIGLKRYENVTTILKGLRKYLLISEF